MRKLTAALLLTLLFGSADAQILNRLRTWTLFDRSGADSGQSIPKDTFRIPPAFRDRPHLAGRGDSLFYWGTATKRWKLYQSGIAAVGDSLSGYPLYTGLFLRAYGDPLNRRPDTLEFDTSAAGPWVRSFLSTSSGGPSTVSSVFNRTGAITALASDYSSFYASLSHAHNASDINLGTLPIARGGTGLSAIGTAGQSVRVNSGGTALEYYTPGGGTSFTVNSPSAGRLLLSNADGTGATAESGLFYSSGIFTVTGRQNINRNRTGQYTYIGGYYIPDLNGSSGTPDYEEFSFGKTEATNQRASLFFKHVGDFSANNAVGFFFPGTAEYLRLEADGDFFLHNLRTPAGTTKMVTTNDAGQLGFQDIPSGSSGSGTVTSFSAGDLSPLFTTTEATATTTPALSFTLSSAAANTIFAPPAGASGTPSWRTMVATDIPSLDAAKIGSGAFASARIAAGTASEGFVPKIVSGVVTWAADATGSTTYSFANSLSNSAGTVTLAGDAATPGASKYYGTDGSGVRGFYSLPTGGSATPGGSSGQLQVNNAGAFGGLTGSAFSGSEVRFGSIADQGAYTLQSGGGSFIQGTYASLDAVPVIFRGSTGTMQMELSSTGHKWQWATGYDAPDLEIFYSTAAGSYNTVARWRLDADGNMQVPGWSRSNYMRVQEITPPGTPGAGFFDIYAKADGKLYGMNDAGTEYDLTAVGSGGSTLTINNNSDNRILTSNGGTSSIDAEAGVTWNGSEFVIPNGRFDVSRNKTGQYTFVSRFYVGDMAGTVGTPNYAEMSFGKNETGSNRASIFFKHEGDGSSNNAIGVFFPGTAELFRIEQDADFFLHDLKTPAGTTKMVTTNQDGQLGYADVPAGEANTASNSTGSGVGFFRQKNTLDLEFKRLNSVSEGGIALGSGTLENTVFSSVFQKSARSSTVTTTGTTATNLQTISLPTSTAGAIRVLVTAIHSDGGSSYVSSKTLSYRVNTIGNVFITGTSTDLMPAGSTETALSGVSWDAITSGQAIVVRAFGKAATTLYWAISYEIIYTAPAV